MTLHGEGQIDRYVELMKTYLVSGGWNEIVGARWLFFFVGEGGVQQGAVQRHPTTVYQGSTTVVSHVSVNMVGKINGCSPNRQFDHLVPWSVNINLVSQYLCL